MDKSQGAHILTFSVQKMIYNYLIVNLILLSYMLFRPHFLASIIKQKRIFVPVATFLTVILLIFWNHTYQEYLNIQKSVPENQDYDNLEYAVWQNRYAKLQRDGYLSICALLSQSLVIGLSYWVGNYDSLVQTKLREEKAKK